MSGRSPVGMKPEAWVKLDDRLREELAHRGEPGARLPVLVSVAGRTAEAAQGTVEEKERKFFQAVEPLLQELKAAGAEQIQRYWLNWTLAADVPMQRIGGIASRADVLQILLVESRHIAL